jgi:hypothetical protein
MMKGFLSRVWRGDATTEQAKDTGMAIVLVLLLLWMFRDADGYVSAAIGAHLVAMAAPQLYRPLAVIWFGLSHLLGTVASRVILTVAFFGVVTPIGVWRRLVGADSLKLRAFKSGTSSVMEERNHTYTGKDLEQPY